MAFIELWQSLRNFPDLLAEGTHILAAVGRVEDCLRRAKDGCDEETETQGRPMTYVLCQIDQAGRANQETLRHFQTLLDKLLERLRAA